MSHDDMFFFFFFFENTFPNKGKLSKLNKNYKTWKKQEIRRGFRVSEVRVIVTWAHWYRYIDQ